MKPLLPTRVSTTELHVDCDAGLVARIFANEGVPIDTAAIDELRALASTQADVLRLADSGVLSGDAGIEKIVCTPDLHKGAGIPIGTVLQTRGFALPQAVGSDIGCGMRLTALNVERLSPERQAELCSAVRHMLFEGGRHVGTSPRLRRRILQVGLKALSEDHPRDGDFWAHVHPADTDTTRSHLRGGLEAEDVSGFDSWIQGGAANEDAISYDASSGAVGGGNHFVEMSVVDRIFDHYTASGYGLEQGQLCVMAHSGSLDFGQRINSLTFDRLKADWPKGMRHPANGLYPGALESLTVTSWHEGLRAATNFALWNRLVLDVCVRQAMASIGVDYDAHVVWDAPHNLAWATDRGYLYRKGATPAGGPLAVADTPYAAYGEPVIVPGSMGASSYVLAGLGSDAALCSACHGAGRALARGRLRDSTAAERARLDEFLARFNVVTPLDVQNARPDIAAVWRAQLVQEAPWAYKEIAPVVETLEQASIARRVVELTPLLTAKS